MLRERDIDKVLISFARWLAGLKPPSGHKHYYFERYTSLSEYAKEISHLRGKMICPFCGRVFKKPSGCVSHILTHRVDIEKIANILRQL